MRNNKNTLPLEIEIENLRQNLKTSNHETVEECERLRSEIQKLYFQMARTTRPGRYAGKKTKIKNRPPKSHSIIPEVIPPGLDVDEYLGSHREIAVSREEKSEDRLSTPPAREATEDQTENCHRDNALVPVIGGQLSPEKYVSPLKPGSQTLHERDATIEERFTIVAGRMKERRRQWLESREKRKPWWKKLGF